MRAEQISIGGIPAILYGDPAGRGYLFLHGQMGRKEEAEAFALAACPRGHQVLSIDLPGVDVVVFGHSHKYMQQEQDGVLWLNPGSCGPRRFHQEITMMMAEVSGGRLRVEKITIPHQAT